MTTIISRMTAFLMLCLTLCVVSCNDKNKPDNPKPSEQEETPIPEGAERIYISAEGSSTRKVLGITPEVFNQYNLEVNGSSVTISKDASGKFYADVEKAGQYNAVLKMKGTSAWYGTSAYSDLIIPFSQFVGSTAEDMKRFPLFASAESGSGKLEFGDGFSVIDVKPKGSSSIISIKIKSTGANLAGKGSFIPSKKRIQLSEGIGFAVMNCTGKSGTGTPLSSGSSFPLIVAPGEYPGGFEITLVDASHKAMVYKVSATELKAGETLTVEFEYRPDEDLLWYEGFDNFVWGGDIMGGSASKGYSPTSETVGIDGATSRTGYEYAMTKVAYNIAGSGFIQPNVWDNVSGKTVGTSHQMSESYVKSRNLTDWTYMFRCQEYQGCIAVAATGSARGIMRTPAFGNIEGVADMRISFDFCFCNGINDDLLCNVIGGGMIKKVITIDGVPYFLTSSNSGYEAANAILKVPHSSVSIPASIAEAKKWHHVVMDIERGGGGTSLYLAGDQTSSMNHGFYVDNIEVRKVADRTKKAAGTVRVLYWNIQNGMWADQANNYNNFVKWVKTYDPDICVWCESETIYKDNTKSSTSSRFLPAGWATLGARYGHTYAATGGDRDNYPQSITSKYPIKTVLKITDSDVSGKPIAHGAAIQEITVGGRTLSFVTCHMWPQAYAYGVNGDSAREASKAEHGGDYYREFEMEYIVKKTINNPEYSGREWILLGDLNSRSRLDNWYYQYSESNTALLTQDVILNKTDLKDVIHETYPNYFIASTGGTSRIDFVYASPALMDKVEEAYIIMDGWTDPKVSKYVSSFRDPSDHRPILVDFKF